MVHYGFSYIGLIYLLMLFIPNIIWAKNKPDGYEEYEKFLFETDNPEAEFRYVYF